MNTTPEAGNVPAHLVKNLRELTGAGFTDCRAALVESGGDLEKAIDVLRKRVRLRQRRKPNAKPARAWSATTSTPEAKSA